MISNCTSCGLSFDYLSSSIPFCRDCILKEKATESVQKLHHKIRRENERKENHKFIVTNKARCFYCVNRCEITEGEYGDCGLRKNIGGRLFFEYKNQDYGILDYYYDPLPTNCVADWVCAGGTGAGYPIFAYKKGPEIGYKNLAVFYRACSFSCLFCQNYHFRYKHGKTLLSVEELADAVDKKTSCICYFGGDPAPQIVHAIRTSKIAIKKKKGEILRICFETNGTMNKKFLNDMITLSLETGGCIKFDLKAITSSLHKALTGSSNEWTLENIKIVAKYIHKRPSPPLLIVSTLLVPGFVNEEEVRKISKFLFSLSPEIPYSLLAYYPCFQMSDTRKTSKDEAVKAFECAKEEGLKNVRIGNIHLLL